jgi:MFS family permease
MKKFWQYEFTVVAIHWFILGFVSLDRLLIAYVFPVLLPELKMDFTQAGFIMSIVGLTWGITCAFGGAISDKYGRKRVIIPATILFTLMSWATGLARSFTQLSYLRGIMGCAEGAYYPAGVATVAEEAKPSRRGSMIGLHQTAFPIWGSFIGAIYATQVAATWGWRWAFYLTLVPGIIIAVCHWIFIKEPKSTSERIQARKRMEEYRIVTETGEHITMKNVFKFRNIILSTIISISFMAWLWTLLTFATVFLTKVKGFEMTTAGFIMSGWGLGGAVGQFFVPALSDLVGRRSALVGSALLGGLATLWFTLAGPNPYLLYFAGFLAGVFGWGAYPLFLDVIPSETVPFALAGLAVGFVTGVGEIVGAAVFPAIGGIFSDAYGLTPTMVGASVAPILGAVLALFIRETAPRKKAVFKPAVSL